MTTAPTEPVTTTPAPKLRFAPSRFCWEQLNRDDAAELWDELIDWVGWFRIRYEATTEIPMCWFRHSRAVEELTALMAAHRAAYEASNGQERDYWSDMIAWHTYHLRPFLGGLNQLGMGGCGAGSCSAMPPARVDLRTSGINEFVGEDVQRRPPAASAASVKPATPMTLTPKQIKERVLSGAATPVDPSDPNTAYKISRTEIWRYNAGRKIFVVDDELPPQTPQL